MKKRSKEHFLKDRAGTGLAYLGGLALYFSTDFTTTSAILHPPTGKMANPVVVTNKQLLVIGIILIAIGFVIDFTRGWAWEWKLLVASLAFFPLWQLLPTLLNK